MAKNVVLQPNFLYSIGIMSPKCNHKGQIKEKELSGEEMAGVCQVFDANFFYITEISNKLVLKFDTKLVYPYKVLKAFAQQRLRCQHL